MTLNLNYQMALGLLFLFSIISAPIFLSSSPINISISTPDLSTIANIFVALGTIFLALITYKSVKASEKQVEILNDTFLLSQKVFSRGQILDHIKTFLYPLISEIEREIPLIQKMDICDGYFRFFGLLQGKMKIQCVDLTSINSFVNNKDDSQWTPHLIYLRENNSELLDLLRQRDGLITSCKLKFGSMKREIHKYDDKIENIILKKFDVHPFEEETGMDSSISIDYVILHSNPEDGSINDLPVPMHEIQRILYSLFLSDILNPRTHEKFPFAFDIDYEYNLIKVELLNIIETAKIKNFQTEIRDICNRLKEIDDLILKNISNVKEGYIKNYRIHSDELR